MHVLIQRLDPTHLSFILTREEDDAVPPLAMLSFRSELLYEVRSDRLALIAYLITKPFLGNHLNLDGAQFPAYMASAIRQDFSGDEIFVTPINNSPHPIVSGKERVQAWLFAESQQPNLDGPITVSRTHYGYDLVGLGHTAYARIYTNLCFFCSLFGEAAAVYERAVLAVLICDMFDGYRLSLKGVGGSDFAEILRLLSLGGIRRED